jgi:mRNA interferase RelE/StbE
LSNEKYSIAETATFEKKTEKPEFKKLYSKIKDYVYPQLRLNPFFGPNIKRLKGNLSEYYRYRTGTYRLFYKISQGKVLVFIIDITHRKDAY